MKMSDVLVQKSCTNFIEIQYFAERSGDGLIYIETEVGAFISKVSIDGGLNFNFKIKSLYKPSLKFTGMVFLQKEFLQKFEKGEELSSSEFSSMLDRIKSKVLRMFNNKADGKQARLVLPDPVEVLNAKEKYRELVFDVVAKNGASYLYLHHRNNEMLKGRLEWVGGIYDSSMDAYRVVHLMGTHYDLSPYAVVA